MFMQLNLEIARVIPRSSAIDTMKFRRMDTTPMLPVKSQHSIILEVRFNTLLYTFVLHARWQSTHFTINCQIAARIVLRKRTSKPLILTCYSVRGRFLACRRMSWIEVRYCEP